MNPDIIRALLVCTVVFFAPTTLAKFAMADISEFLSKGQVAVRVTIVSGDLAQYSYVGGHKTCGTVYRARVVDSIRGSVAPGEEIAFADPGDLQIGADYFLILYHGNGDLLTDVLTEYDEPELRLRNECLRRLPEARTLWIATSKFVSGVSVNCCDSDCSKSEWVTEGLSVLEPEGVPRIVIEPSPATTLNGAPVEKRMTNAPMMVGLWTETLLKWDEYKLHMLGKAESNQSLQPTACGGG